MKPNWSPCPWVVAGWLVLASVAVASPGEARQASPAQPPAAADDGRTPAAQPTASDADLTPDPAQPDFTLIGLPTTLRIANHKSAFRVTHRFTRPLGAGTFGSLVEDFFGFDAGALIGLEYRFGLRPGTQVGIHRTSDRTIEFFGQHELLSQDDGRPLSLNVWVSVEGLDNFREEYSPALGAILSRKVGLRGALYLQPIWIGNTNPLPDALAAEDDTLIVGVGTRLRIGRTVYVVAEMAPRVGHDPGVMHGSVALEKRVGGHSFQLNFSDSFGTTIGQIARGGFDESDWYIGFNISRKFY